MKKRFIALTDIYRKPDDKQMEMEAGEDVTNSTFQKNLQNLQNRNIFQFGLM